MSKFRGVFSWTTDGQVINNGVQTVTVDITTTYGTPVHISLPCVTTNNIGVGHSIVFLDPSGNIAHHKVDLNTGDVGFKINGLGGYEMTEAKYPVIFRYEGYGQWIAIKGAPMGNWPVGTDDLPWSSYTVTWTAQSGTQPSIGNGTLTGHYKLIGKTAFVRVKLNAGTTTTFGNATSNAWLFGLPFTAKASEAIQFPCSILDNGVAWYQGTVNGTYAGNTNNSAIIVATTNANAVGVTYNSPFTWGATDSLQFNGSYEVL